MVALVGWIDQTKEGLNHHLEIHSEHEIHSLCSLEERKTSPFQQNKKKQNLFQRKRKKRKKEKTETNPKMLTCILPDAT